MEQRAFEFWVGVFVLMGFAAMLVLALKVGNLELGAAEDTYTVTAPFSNIGGLRVRAAVRASGVTVGRVVGIDYDSDNYEAEVHLAINERFKFPTDTTASILTSGILGENYIGLDAGGEEENLKDGDRIQITQSAVLLERVIGQFLYNQAQQQTESEP
jgi:phospholipid/cholesterol/gamma-HCH transport system substrate-binding protein